MSRDVYKRLESLEKIGIKLGLQNIQLLLQQLGNPQQSYPSILIAGTNGKGSVGAMLARILSLHGFCTGHYISPHLIDVRERIQVGQQMIPLKDFKQTLRLVFQTIDQLIETSVLSAIPTYFETLTAVALHYFRNRKVDFAVVEVGLGGRFDATNVVRQRLSIITSIDFDHEEFLGRSLREIAGEKAGIIKYQAPVVAGILPQEALEVIKNTAGRQQCNVVTVDTGNLDRLRLEDGFPVFFYRPWEETIRVNLRGKHQALNAVAAILACEELERIGVSIQRKKVIDGLNEVSWPGRLELVSTSPPILVDCAHNPMGVCALTDFLQEIRWERVVILFTAMSDKNISRMLKIVAPKVQTIFLTRVEPYQRCANLDRLAEVAHAAGVPFEVEENSIQALQQAQEHAVKAGLPLVVFGSIYLIGKVLQHLPSTI